GSMAESFYTEWEESYVSFNQMSLHEDLLHGLHAYGFEKPSAIQQKGIVPFAKGLDVIQQAQLGTGRIATFCAGILQNLDYNSLECQALVLAPTRELAQHVAKVMRAVGKFQEVKCHCFVSGPSLREDIRILEGGIQVVVGTPGRIQGLLRRRALHANSIRMLVLDEADELLSPAIKELIYEIFQLLPGRLQVGVFCANLPPEVLALTRKFMNNPVHILVKRDGLNFEGLRQFYVNVEHEGWKLDTLCDLRDILAIDNILVFANTTRKMDWLADKMRERGINMTAINISSREQDGHDSMARKRDSNSCHGLITTAADACGIDEQQASLVINYDLPTQPENYLHRIGRLGSKRLAISFVTGEEQRLLQDIERYCNTVIEELPANVADLL
ncbi:eukaryotic initiation factor 4A-11, partial [Coccomyxa subellipsoidea C-169]